MASISPICKCVLHNLIIRNFNVISRCYTIRAPKWMGYNFWKGYNQDKEETNPIYSEKTFAQIMTEQNESHINKERPNIGLPVKHKRPSQREMYEQKKKNRANAELERAARFRQLEVKLDVVSEDWKSEAGPSQTRTAAEHYGIYSDLFDNAYFYPTKQMTVAYEYDTEYVTPVYRGNKIPAEEAQKAPIVEFEDETDKFYTLIMTNPDSHLSNNDAEVLHWMVGNISNGDIQQGELLCDYLPPFPARGTGFHRHIFVLFQHDKKIDFSSEKQSQDSTRLAERTFKTAEFYARHEDDMTPVGLCFFQSEWDHSVRNIFHSVLNMKEPEFEYKFPHPYHPRQVLYPKQKEPFDRYFDRYRDKKDLAEEVLKMKMDMISPFKPNPKKPEFPTTIHKDMSKPSWLRKREDVMSRRIEQFADLPQ